MKKKVQKVKSSEEKSDNKIRNYIDIQRAKSDEDAKRYIRIVSEEFQGRVSEMGKRFDDVDKKLANIDGEVSEIRETQKSHTEMIGRLATDVEVIKGNVEIIKGALKKKVDYDEFLALERRITLLESKTK